MFFINTNIRMIHVSNSAEIMHRQGTTVCERMFGKTERRRKDEGKSEKHVDTGGIAWYYIQALEKRGLARGIGRARES
jgi:hypothetical protein